MMPPAPFFLTHHVVHLSVESGRLRSAMEDSLRMCGADFEYNACKWKAKAYVYRPSGFVNFAMRAYTEAGPNGNELYLVELQRRRGCHVMFQSVYDTILQAFAKSGALQQDSPSARRVAEIASAKTRETATGVADEASKNSAALPPPTFNRVSLPSHVATEPLNASVATSEGGYASDRSVSSTASAASNADTGKNAAELGMSKNAEADSSMVVDALTTLTTMLASEYDDVACPAAQSIAALCVSKRVRKALGLRAVAALEKGSGADQTAQPVLQLFENLMARACNPYLSIESRTSCAIALSELAKDSNCARALFRTQLPARLLAAVLHVPQCAAGAAFRRQAIEAVHSSMKADADAVSRGAVARSLLDSARACTAGPSADPLFTSSAKGLTAHLESVAGQVSPVSASSRYAAYGARVGLGVPVVMPAASVTPAPLLTREGPPAS
jgi:hypothetical protein